MMGMGVKELENSSTPMLVAAVSSILLGIYSFALPHTPPKDTESPMSVSKILGLDALVLLKRWPFAVFVVGSFLIAIPLQFYYNYTNFFLGDVGVANAVGKMTFGQMSEIFFMLLIPFFFVRLGVKYMLLIGMSAWVARYVLFAFGDAGAVGSIPVTETFSIPGMGFWMLFLGILLHGICYDFFFVTGQIYFEKNANERIRGAAQGFITFVTLGVGAFVGANLSGIVESAVRTDGVVNWTQFWLIPAGIAGVVMIGSPSCSTIRRSKRKWSPKASSRRVKLLWRMPPTRLCRAWGRLFRTSATLSGGVAMAQISALVKNGRVLRLLFLFRLSLVGKELRRPLEKLPRFLQIF
jgi:nucleoside transporter